MITNTIKFKSAFLLLCFFSTTVCSNELNLPDDIELLYINKEKPDFLTFGQSVEIGLGQQQLILRYNKTFKKSGEHTEVSSEPMVISFTTSKNDNLTLSIPKIIRSKQAIEFVKHPQISLTLNPEKTPFPHKLHILSPYSGFSFNRDILSEVATWEKSQTTVDNKTALEMLKFWYKKSDKKTQKTFRIWLIENE